MSPGKPDAFTLKQGNYWKTKFCNFCFKRIRSLFASAASCNVTQNFFSLTRTGGTHGEREGGVCWGLLTPRSATSHHSHSHSGARQGQDPPKKAKNCKDFKLISEYQAFWGETPSLDPKNATAEVDEPVGGGQK